MKARPSAKPGPIASAPDHASPGAPRFCHTASRLPLKRILVPVDFADGSVAALDYAAALAGHFHAELVLLHVVEPSTRAGGYGAVSPSLEGLHQSQVQAGRDRLAALARKRVNHQVPFQTLVRIGRAYSEIPDTANALGTDLIVLGSEGQTAAQRALSGGTTERVVRHAPCPVLTLRPPPAP